MIPKKHLKALKELYIKHGVGEKTSQKLAYWQSSVEGGYNFSHNPSDKTKVALCEQFWLTDKFPEDAIFC